MVQSHLKLQLRSTPSLKFLLVMVRSYVYSNRVINSNSMDVDDLITKNDQWHFGSTEENILSFNISIL